MGGCGRVLEGVRGCERVWEREGKGKDITMHEEKTLQKGLTRYAR